VNPSRLAALASVLFACGCQESTIAIRVVAADGGDPFLPPDAATQARFRFEGRSAETVTTTVAANGFFSLETPFAGAVTGRGIVEALRMGEVVGGGATPPLAWDSVGASVLTVFVQRRDSIVEYAWRLRNARTSPALFEAAPSFALAVGGTVATQAIESFNVLTLSGAADGSPYDNTLGRDASFVVLSTGSVLIVSGCNALLWNPLSNQALVSPMAMSMATPPSERCDVRGSTVVQEPGGGGILLGGRGPMGPVARVDIVNPDGTWATALPMAVPRVRPEAVRTGVAEALIAGGQEAGSPFLERYTRTLTADARPVRTGMAAVDDRRDAALVDLGGGVVLALGGTSTTGTDLSPNDVVLNARCVDGSCPVVLSTPTLLRERRRNAVAALAEEGRVVVASGSGASGVAASVEVIDASAPRMPVSVGPIGMLPYDGLTARKLAMGAVLFAGGGTTQTWLYRH
jgi:hypothetical protein